MQSVNSAIKSICDIMRRSNCAGAMQYVPELTWILFLRILDEREEQEEMMAEAVGQHYIPSLEAPYRWRDWAAPDGAKRVELQQGTLGAFFDLCERRPPAPLESTAGQTQRYRTAKNHQRSHVWR